VISVERVCFETDFFASVPKFFRWLSERYPAISQLIAENRIPEFDCLYVRPEKAPMMPTESHSRRFEPPHPSALDLLTCKVA
jgi:hypothetical protein